jgi:hypothetical protein
LEDPVRTSTAFQEAGAGQPRRFLTGDLGRWLPDGQLECRGRIDHQVKVRGHRVELAEIEMALRKLNIIAEAAVVVPANGTDVRIVAHIVPTKSEIDLGSLRTLLAETLPTAMLPARYQVHESLPRTATGKVDRLALASAPARVDDLQVDATVWPSPLPSAAEEDATARIIMSVWRELLGVASISEDDDFFMLGGDSLIAMRACSHLTARLQVQIDLRDIIEAPTIRQFIRRLAAGRKTIDPATISKELRTLIAEIETMPIDEVRRQLNEKLPEGAKATLNPPCS